jgi:hydrogenase maturation protein HypF
MADARSSELIRVRGLVQGVGFRPTVCRLARRHGLRGWVGNDGGGVAMSVSGAADDIAAFVTELRHAPPPLARIDAIERTPSAANMDAGEFRIVESRTGDVRTGVVPDAVTCAACRQEIFNPDARRFRYPFTNCTHCGPRLSIIETIPYDRASTTMRAFRMCADCAADYTDPADRRFHAQPIACAACGPRLWLETPAAVSDPLNATRDLLLAGEIVAVKGLGGFHLACDATNRAAVERLRRAKRRDAKPFALIAHDLSVIRHHAVVTEEDAAALQSPAGPIVLMQARSPDALPGIAPGLTTLGFMLPSTPLHHLLLDGVDRPLVMTSGNLSDEPQCIGNEEALQRLSGIAGHFLLHDRDIARRVDDSVVRVLGGRARVLRRARGYAPAPIALPEGFTQAPPLLAMGGELKNTFCLLRDGQAILSHHMGDVENASAFADCQRSIVQYSALFAHRPQAIAVDRHPDYLSTKLGAELAARDRLPVLGVQHHHAHLAACMVENGVARDAGPVLGIVLDGLGWGDDGTVWGGEILLGDYRGCRRLACLRPVPMPGGAQAIREPWRNAFAQIHAGLGWDRFVTAYGTTGFGRYLLDKPVAALRSMIQRGVNAPLTSSCGRLFDAVAAAAGFCRDRALYEGQAAMMLEAAAHTAETDPYPFGIAEAGELLHLDPAPLWPALLDDLAAGVSAGMVAARFHSGLAAAVVRLIDVLGISAPIALTGGVFQNRLLLEQVVQRLAAQGHRVLTHQAVPANDGGLALGQAAIAAARLLSGDEGG